MTAKEKMYTIEISEKELARVLFVMRSVNGKVYGKAISYSALGKLMTDRIGTDTLEDKRRVLAEKANLPKCIDYYLVQDEWESFLGISDGVNYKAVLDKVISLEKELAELKKMI